MLNVKHEFQTILPLFLRFKVEGVYGPLGEGLGHLVLVPADLLQAPLRTKPSD